MSIPVALTIAGSDPSGSAGIQADLKTFQAFEVYGMSVISLITAQNTKGIRTLEVLSTKLVEEQLDLILSDIQPRALKLGALGNAEIVEMIASKASDFEFPMVIDPVFKSKNEYPLLDESAIEIFKKSLLPYACLLTPNLQEAERLTGRTVRNIEQMKDACKMIHDLGSSAVLITGGHLASSSSDVFFENNHFHIFSSERNTSTPRRGTGCTFSAAIAAGLAKGHPLKEAIQSAKTFITKSIQSGYQLGEGFGSLNYNLHES